MSARIYLMPWMVPTDPQPRLPRSEEFRRKLRQNPKLPIARQVVDKVLFPLPRIDVSAHQGDDGSVVYDVELVRSDGPGGFDVLATFRDAEEAERFVERYMGEHAEGGG